MAEVAEMEDALMADGPVTRFTSSNNKRIFVVAIVVLALFVVLLGVVVLALSITLGVERSHSDNEDNATPTTNIPPTSNATPTDIIPPTTNVPPTTITICLTPECVQLSAQVLSGLDEAVNPCQNFYNFSCGNWARNTLIPDGRLSGDYNPFKVLDAYNKRRLRDSLVEMEGRDVEAIAKVQDLYQSCLNTGVTNSLGMEPAIRVMELVGGWPLVGINSSTPWDLNGEQFVQEKLLGSGAFFTMAVCMDDRKASRYIIYVKNSGLTLDEPILYTNENNIDKITVKIVQMLVMLNPTGDMMSFFGAADEIMRVERILSQIYQNPHDIDPEDLEFTTLNALASLWPEYDWVQNAQRIFGAAGVDDIDGDEPIIIRTPQYFQRISSVLQGIPRKALENYAKWQLLWPLMQYLDDDCVEAYYRLKQDTNPRAQIPTDRNEMCIGILESKMPVGLSRVYAEFILPEGSVERAAEMTSNVMQGFRERIQSRPWLDEQTRQRAIRKVDLMESMIAYPDMVFNDDWLNTLYADYTISSTQLFENYFQIGINMVLRNFGQLREPVDLWTTVPPMVMATATKVNAFNYPLLNKIFILEGIMDAPFLNPNWPLYFQYGALGVLLGHEITHGFDNNGRKYNETGQMEEWWTQASVDNFINRTQCYVDQYSDFNLFGINVDGTSTLGENIADNGGIIASYLAYKSAVEKDNIVPPTLPGVNYTADQLFFIAFSQLWCTYTTPGAFDIQVLIDVHSPGPFRVLGTLQNSPEFAEAFQCSIGSPMNPPDKCSLW